MHSDDATVIDIVDCQYGHETRVNEAQRPLKNKDIVRHLIDATDLFLMAIAESLFTRPGPGEPSEVVKSELRAEFEG